VIEKGTSFANLPNQEERAVGGARVLIASCLWVAASLTPAWTAGPGEAQQGGDYVQGAFSLPYPFSLSEEPDSSLYMNLKGLRLAPSQVSSSTVLDETGPALQGVKARYEIGLENYSFEFSGGYVPEMKSLVLSESSLDPRAYLGYVDLTMPLSQFYLKGGAFFGQNVEALGMIFKRPFEEQNPKRELLGYQISGGYRFSDSLSIQAGWAQAVQEYEMAREGLGAWYLQAQISLGWRMSVTPQAGFIDITTGDREKIKEEAFYCGARWQINF
jgi:hypothetical protein